MTTVSVEGTEASCGIEEGGDMAFNPYESPKSTSIEAPQSTPTSKQARASGGLFKGMIYGLLVGWIVGMLWWVSLAIYLGPSGRTYIHDGITEETHTSVLDNCVLAPIVASPWAVVGGFVGTVISWIGGWLEIMTCFVGMLWALIDVPLSHDGWLVFTMPIHAFAGTIIGLAGGCIVRLLLRGCRWGSKKGQNALGKLGNQESF